MVEKLGRDLSETQAALFEEGQQKGKLQMELDAKESEIEQLRQKLAVSDNVSINSSHLEDGDVSLTSACKYIIMCKYIVICIIIIKCYFIITCMFLFKCKYIFITDTYIPTFKYIMTCKYKITCTYII